MRPRMTVRFKLGDAVAGALAAVGITPERVEAALGRPCGCKARREKLNRLSDWALGVHRGETDGAAERLDAIIAPPKPPEAKQ